MQSAGRIPGSKPVTRPPSPVKPAAAKAAAAKPAAARTTAAPPPAAAAAAASSLELEPRVALAGTTASPFAGASAVASPAAPTQLGPASAAASSPFAGASAGITPPPDYFAALPDDLMPVILSQVPECAKDIQSLQRVSTRFNQTMRSSDGRALNLLLEARGIPAEEIRGKTFEAKLKLIATQDKKLDDTLRHIYRLGFSIDSFGNAFGHTPPERQANFERFLLRKPALMDRLLTAERYIENETYWRCFFTGLKDGDDQPIFGNLRKRNFDCYGEIHCYGEVTYYGVREKFYGVSDGILIRYYSNTREEGNFSDNAGLEGKGKITNPDGTTLEGTFESGYIKTGHGVQIDDGIRAEGAYKNSQLEGEGKIIFPNGNRYEGVFESGNCDNGTLIKPDGTRIPGKMEPYNRFTPAHSAPPSPAPE